MTAIIASSDAIATSMWIEELREESRRRKRLSDKHYRLANRRRKDLYWIVRERHDQRGRAGNVQSRRIADDPRHLEILTDAECKVDPTWLGYVDDQKFNERLANQAAHQAQMEMFDEMLRRMT